MVTKRWDLAWSKAPRMRSKSVLGDSCRFPMTIGRKHNQSDEMLSPVVLMMMLGRGPERVSIHVKRSDNTTYITDMMEDNVHLGTG